MTETRFAFVRVEGVLLRRGVLAGAAYVAANAEGLSGRLARLGQLAIGAPVVSLLGQTDRTTAGRIAHLPFRDLSEDRLAILGDEYFEEIVEPNILEGGRELIKTLRKDGFEVVLISEQAHVLIGRLLEEVRGVEHLVTNRLELRNGRASGRLLDPVVGGHGTRKWARELCAKHGTSLDEATAYASTGGDMLLLAAVGRPCAVNPDFTLRKAAIESDWPVIDYRA